MDDTGSRKQAFPSIPAKNRVIDNIIHAIDKGESFVLVGHKGPDEDCIASMVAFALLLTKFSKEARILLPEQINEQYNYLLEICKFNSIRIDRDCCEDYNHVDTLVICDTAKTSMISPQSAVQDFFAREDLLRIELDHHLHADSNYSGHNGYCLVDEATSTGELVGILAIKLRNYPELLARYNVEDLFSRNIVLAILTGIIGDTKLGKYLKSRRERRLYDGFSKFYNELLLDMTVTPTNFFTMDEVFRDLQQLSTAEAQCYGEIMLKREIHDYIGTIILNEDEISGFAARYDWDTIASVSRAAADAMAEQTGYLGMVGYIDDPERSGLVQFRLRRSQGFKKLDLRTIVDKFAIKNGGGHQGAVAFRFPRDEVEDIHSLADYLVGGIQDMVRQSLGGD